MRLKYSKWVLVLLFAALVTDSVTAQRRTRRRTGGSAYGNQQQTNNSGYGNPDTTRNPSQSAYGNAAPAGPAFDTTLPINRVQSSGGGLFDSVKMSLRNDAAIERSLVKERTPLDYENLREDDAVYRVRVWREIDIREKINLPFRYAATEDNGGQRFISILLTAIKQEGITAFSSDDDRFTTPITPEDAIKAFGGGEDTAKKYDLDGNVIGYEIRPKPLSPDSVYKFRLKEEWIFDKESSRMFVRVLGIAPVMPYKLSTGQALENSERPLWWVYYPDLRPVLSKFEVYNPKNFGARMTWEELFEGRMFSSYIVKSTIDNPYDRALADYVKDPLFRLLEGEKIKDKIFDYEQSLWSY